MSKLTIFKLSEFDEYMVDVTGTRWSSPVETWDDDAEIVCDSCHEEMLPKDAYQSEEGRIQCGECFDIVREDLVYFLNLNVQVFLLDLGFGEFALKERLQFLTHKDTERSDSSAVGGPTHEDGELIARHNGTLCFWRDIIINGVLYGYSYTGEVR